MDYSIQRYFFLLLMSLLAGFSITCMEQELSMESLYTFSTLDDYASHKNKKKILPILHQQSIPGILYASKEIPLADVDISDEKHSNGTSSIVRNRSGVSYTTKEERAEARSGNISAVACSPDGKTLITGSLNGLVCFWNAKNGKFIKVCGDCETPVDSIVCSSDGTLFLTQDTQAVRLWDLATGKNLWGFQSKGFSSPRVAALSSNNERLLVGFSGTTACLVDVTNKKVLCHMDKHPNSVFTTFNADNSVALIEHHASSFRAISFYDASTGALKRTITDYCKRIVYSPDGMVFALLVQDSTHKLTIYDATTGIFLSEIEKKSPIESATFSPSGNVILTVSSFEKEVCITHKAGTVLKKLSREDLKQANEVTWSPDEHTVFIGLGHDGKGLLWDSQTENEPLELLQGHSHRILSAVFSHDGKKLFTLSMGKICCCDTATGEKNLELIVPTKLAEIMVSPCGKIIFAKERYGKSVHLWILSDSSQEIESAHTELLSSKTNRTNGHTQGVNLNNDSQECSIQ